MFGQFNRRLWVTMRRVAAPLQSAIGCVFPIGGLIFGSIVGSMALSQTVPKLTEADRASTRSLGAVKIGMTVRQASRAAGLPFVRIGGGEAQCQYYQPSQRIKGIALMVTNGVISRVDITNPRISTLSGIKVGDTEQKAISIYGSKIRRQQHKYNSKGHYLVYIPENRQDRKYQIVFETDGRHIESWRFGKAEEVNWVEGCS